MAPGNSNVRRCLCAAPALVLLMAGCADRKQVAYSSCHATHVAHYVQPRPQGSPPDDFLLRSIDVCMMSHGYRMDASDPVCASPRTIGLNCFRPATPLTWVRSVFD